VAPSVWLEKLDKGMPMFNSAKTEKMMEQIKKWLIEAPKEKLIIFTQWRTFATTAGRMLEDMDCPFVYYTVSWPSVFVPLRKLTPTYLLVIQGDKAPQKRAIALKKIPTEDCITVMIASLGCGGVGLNLGFASRVINM
jgi:SNF2 family DNA or RNA helicase